MKSSFFCPLKLAATAVIVGIMVFTATHLYEDMNEREHNELPIQVRLMTAVSETDGGIIEIDPLTLQITSCTAAAENLFGYSKQSLAGQNLDVLLPSWFRREHHEIMRHRQKHHDGVEVAQCEAVRKDGSSVEIATIVFSNKVSGKLMALVIPSNKVHSHSESAVAKTVPEIP